MSIKPILFNTEMVKAILDGRKTVTRRKIDAKAVEAALNSPARIGNPELLDRQFIECLCTAPCEAGDVLWVRETWADLIGMGFGNDPQTDKPWLYAYKSDIADGSDSDQTRIDFGVKWRPSIHMPKSAARLFLRVNAVRVERLQEMDNAGAKAEGVTAETDNSGKMHRSPFVRLWDSTIKPADISRYGWDANPWVWVIEFERCELPEDFLKEDATMAVETWNSRTPSEHFVDANKSSDDNPPLTPEEG